MDFLLHLLTTDPIPKEQSRQIWLLEQKFNAGLKKRSFHSPRQQYGLWVEATPPRPEWFQSASPKAEVKLDRRDGAIRTVVVGDFDRYKASSLAEGVDLFVGDAERAIRQVPAKYLLPDEVQPIIEELERARRAYHLEHTGFVPERCGESGGPIQSPAYDEGDDAAVEPIQIVVQWLDGQFQSMGDPASDQLSSIEEVLETGSNGLYYVDGHDSGSGTINIFLYTDAEEAALAQLIALAEQGVLPSGVRIGLPEAARVRAVYPPGLREFELADAPLAQNS